MCVSRSIDRACIRLLELSFHKMMAQCDFLNDDQVGRTLDGLGHSLARSIGLVMSPVGPNWERSLRYP